MRNMTMVLLAWKPNCLAMESVNIQKTDTLDADNFSCRNIKNRRKIRSRPNYYMPQGNDI